MQIRSAPGIQFDLTRSIVDDDQKILMFQSLQRDAAQLRAASGAPFDLAQSPNTDVTPDVSVDIPFDRKGQMPRVKPGPP